MTVISIRDPGGGANQSGLRDRNARLVLSYIRRHGAMAGAEIARRSGLSAQTVSNIMRVLEGDGLVMRGAVIKGRVGKPSVPMALNPDGVLSLGLNIGRRSVELVLVDFVGRQRDTEVLRYRYPARDQVFSFVQDQIPAMLARNGVEPERVAGIGIARPNRIWEWLEFVNAPDGALQDWRALDLGAEMSRLTGFDPVIENDATSACVAENLLGRGHEFHDFAHIFVGAFVGGGLVLDGKVISGRTHNTAAFGPLPVPDGKGGTVQLLDVASLHVLERALEEAGQSMADVRTATGDWDLHNPALAQWLDTTSRNLAIACAAITSIIEVEAILVDGAFPENLRTALTRQISEGFSELDITGIEKPQILEAATGRRARSIGAALLPINAKYFVT